MNRPTPIEKVVLSVKDGDGVEHKILGDDFAGEALHDIIGRLTALESFVVDLVNRDALVGKDLRERAAAFVKGRS